VYASYVRGNLVFYDEEAGMWFYEDGVCVDDDPDRPCPVCGRWPTPDGYDPCLGKIEGCISACCGHGRHEPFFIFKEVN